MLLKLRHEKEILFTHRTKELAPSQIRQQTTVVVLLLTIWAGTVGKSENGLPRKCLSYPTSLHLRTYKLSV